MSITIEYSKRINSLGGYAFAEVGRIVEDLKARGITPIDFGVGDPLDPTPELVRETVKNAVDRHATSGYPSYIGSKNYREAAAAWMNRRFGVELDPEKEIASTIGSKEAVFHFPEAFLNPGDVAIIPSPGYPPMKTGTLFAEGTPYFVPLLESNGFMLDVEAIPDDVAEKAKILWINYPNSPTGATATREYYKRLVAWSHERNILIAADEGCYIDIYFGEKPMSILEVEREGVLTFYSMSKRNNMTGYRIGFVAGDERIVTAFKKLKTNIDSGTPDFIQDAAIAALENETHAESMRLLYREKRDILVEALQSAGLEVSVPPATFYIWFENAERAVFARIREEAIGGRIGIGRHTGRVDHG